LADALGYDRAQISTESVASWDNIAARLAA
jgi:hypothetical protein